MVTDCLIDYAMEQKEKRFETIRIEKISQEIFKTGCRSVRGLVNNKDLSSVGLVIFLIMLTDCSRFRYFSIRPTLAPQSMK